MIPKQLQQEGFKFILLGKGKKIPIEQKWQTEKNYPYNNQLLNKHLNYGGNYGVVGGYNNLLVIDFDDQNFQDKYFPLLPPTLTIKTGGGGLHLYYICDDCPSLKILDSEKNTLADIQGRGKQVVGANSTHPNGNKYEMVQDIPLAKIKLQSLKLLFSEYLKEKDKPKTKDQKDDVVEQIKSKVRIPDLLGSYGVDTSKNPTSCPLGHSSKGGKCFSFNDELFNCFHCDEAGDVFSLVQKREKCDFVEAKNKLMEEVGIKITQKVNKKLKNFIFDENEVIKEVSFNFPIIDDNLCFGYFLPKDVPVYKTNKETKQREYKGQKQIKVPVLITSNNELIEVSALLEEKSKIRIIDLPNASNYPRRWSLSSIKDFLEKKDSKIEPKETYSKIKKTYEQYICFNNPTWYSVHALWDIGTYFFSLFLYYPLMELRGLKRTGKTKIMTASRQFTFNATEEMTNPSESTLFRVTHEQRPTKYIDEAEKLYIINRGKIEADSRAELINSGYKYTGTVPRQEKQGNKYITIYYKTYSPTMLGSINGLYGATEDRAIVHITTSAPKGDNRGEKELQEGNPTYKQIRDELYLLALQNWDLVREEYSKLNIKTKLSNRDFWLWKPILVLAKVIDESLFEEIKKFAEELTDVKVIDSIPEGSTEFNILSYTNELLKQGRNPILVKDILSFWNSDDKYKPANKTIASHLDRMGFMEFKSHSRNGTCYKINREHFESVVYSICPKILKLSSLPSPTSQKEEIEPILVVEEEIVCEERVKMGEEKNKICEGVKEMKEMKHQRHKTREKIELTSIDTCHHKCYNCEKTPCNFQDNKFKPYCLTCAKQTEHFEVMKNE